MRAGPRVARLYGSLMAAGDENDEHRTLTLVPQPTLPAVPSDSRQEIDTEVGTIPRIENDAPDLEDLPLAMRERITLRGLHSSGGIGEVWRAYDEVIGREVALKRLQSGQYADAHRARFSREARLTGQLEHPGIVPVYDYSPGADGARCFYTMRFVRGRTLREVVREFHDKREAEGRPLLGSEFMVLLGHFLTVCNTMAFAHSRQVIHRDLKGDNIIVGAFGEVLVLDWGLAKHLGEAELPNVDDQPQPSSPLETRQGEQLGTPAYMAPEQALGHIDRIDERTDVYGLAALLYELLTARPPFLGDKLDDVLTAVIGEPPRPPRELVVDVPPELERICLRGLAKARSDRPQSVTEFSAAIARWQTTLAERKRVEQERERFFDLSLDLLAIVERGGSFGQTNAAWASELGRTPEALAESTWIDEVLEVDRERARAQLDAVFGELDSASIELRMRHAEGGYRWVDWSLRALPDDVGVYLVGREVTARKQASQEVEGLLESAPDATCVIDERGTIVRVNAQLERMFGYDRAELVGGPVEQLVPTRLRERHVGHVARYVSEPATRPMGSGLQLIGERRDGSEFPVEVSLSPVRTETKLLVSCTLRDVSERRRQERMMQAILEAAPDAMITVDAAHVIRLVNRQAEQLFGYGRDELLGQPIELLVPEAVREVHREHTARYTESPSVRTMGVGRVLHAQRKDGSKVAVEVSLSPVETDDGLMIASAIRPATKT